MIMYKVKKAIYFKFSPQENMKQSCLPCSSSSSSRLALHKRKTRHMDCAVCSSMPFILRPPRNTICVACYDGARSVIALINKLENEKAVDKSLPSSPNSSKPLSNLTKWINSMKDTEEELREQIIFLGGFVAAFRDKIHPDIQIKPGTGGPPIPAHKALLAARSVIFKNMLDSDGCKAPPSDTVTFPELGHDELESLLEFLYSGSLPLEKVDKHVYSLSLAADKYEIPFLQKFCERHMLGSLNSSNVLDVLEISDACSNQTLKDSAMNFIIKNVEDIIFSPRYDTFALKNPHLGVQILRNSLMDSKSRRNGT